MTIMRSKKKEQEWLNAMDNNDIIKKIIESHKAAFLTGFDAVVMLQEQTSKLAYNILRQHPCVPEEARAAMNEWRSLYKQGIKSFKEAADQHYEKLEALLKSGAESRQA